MKIYHGERTNRGCEVTVDGETLLRRADLSGNDSSPFDWGFIGTGQLSMAILSDFLGDDPKAKALCAQFEKHVVAELPHRAWTLSGKDLDKALVGMHSSPETVISNEHDAPGAAFADMPAKAVVVLSMQEAVVESAGGASGPASAVAVDSPEATATASATDEVKAAAGKMVDAANSVAAAALAVGKAAHQVAHASDQPADEAMSIATRAADHQADAANRAVDEAAVMALAAADEANRVLASLQKPAL